MAKTASTTIEDRAEKVEVVSLVEDHQIRELAVYPAKAKRNCYAFYVLVDDETGRETVFWMHHGAQEEDDIDLGKSYRTLLPALKAALQDAEKTAGRGNPRLVASLKRAVAAARKR